MSNYLNRDDITDPQYKLEIALMRILVLQQFKLFGCIIYNFDIKLIKNKEDIERIKNSNLDETAKNVIIQKIYSTLSAKIVITNEKPTIIIYEHFIDQYTIPEIMFEILHLILHVISGHPQRCRTLDKKYYNIASDHAINKILLSDISSKNLPVKMPDNAVIIDKFMYDDLTTEEIYDYLTNKAKSEPVFQIAVQQESKDNKQDSDPQDNENLQISNKPENDDSSNKKDSKEKLEKEDTKSPDNQQEKDEQENKKDENDDNSKESEESEKSKEVDKLENQNENNDIDDTFEELKQLAFGSEEPLEIQIEDQTLEFLSDIDSDSDSSLINEELATENIQAQIRALIDSDKLKGLISGELETYIKKIIKVKIPWDVLLQRAILTKVVPCKDNRSWRIPYKRFRAHNIILPGPDVMKKTTAVAILKDTSGSISDKQFKRFSDIIIQSLSHFDMVWLIQHDVQVHDSTRIKVDKLSPDLLIENNSDAIFKNKGRGGTSHKYAFNLIEKAYLEENIELGLVVLLTDFYSDIETIWKKYEWTKNIPVIVMLTNKARVPDYVDPNPIHIEDDVE